MIDEHTRLESCLRDLQSRRPFEDYLAQPDTAERTRLAVQSLPFALPAKRMKWDPLGEPVVWPQREGESP